MENFEWYHIPLTLVFLLAGAWLHSRSPNYKGKRKRRK